MEKCAAYLDSQLTYFWLTSIEFGQQQWEELNRTIEKWRCNKYTFIQYKQTQRTSGLCRSTSFIWSHNRWRWNINLKGKEICNDNIWSGSTFLVDRFRTNSYKIGHYHTTIIHKWCRLNKMRARSSRRIRSSWMKLKIIPIMQKKDRARDSRYNMECSVRSTY